MEIEPEFMRPAILHGFGTNAKKRLPGRLTELAHFGWMPLAAALFGTVKWLPQWMHHNFLPVIGLRVHAKVPPSPLTDRQLVGRGWGPRYLANKRERGPARVPRLLSEGKGRTR